MALDINKLYVEFDSRGVPNVQCAGYVRQGTKGVDQILVKFKGYEDNLNLVAIFNGERADGESCETGLLMKLTRQDDGSYWYEYTFGEYEPESHPFSWWTAKPGFINLNIMLMDDEQTYVNGVTKIGVEETYGFDNDVARSFQVIAGIYEEIAKRATTEYVNTHAIQPLTEHDANTNAHPSLRAEVRKRVKENFTDYTPYDSDSLDAQETLVINKSVDGTNVIGKTTIDAIRKPIQKEIDTACFYKPSTLDSVDNITSTGLVECITDIYDDVSMWARILTVDGDFVDGDIVDLSLHYSITASIGGSVTFSNFDKTFIYKKGTNLQFKDISYSSSRDIYNDYYVPDLVSATVEIICHSNIIAVRVGGIFAPNHSGVFTVSPQITRALVRRCS